MNVRIFWVHAMKCMYAQTRPRFILSSEGVFGGMEFEPMLTPREKIPSTENVPRGGSNPQRCGQRAQALPTELFRPPKTCCCILCMRLLLLLLWMRLLLLLLLLLCVVMCKCWLLCFLCNTSGTNFHLPYFFSSSEVFVNIMSGFLKTCYCIWCVVMC